MMGGDAQVLFGDLAAETEVPAEQHQVTRGAVQFIVAALLIAVVAAAGVGGVWAGFRTFVLPTTANGVCFTFAPENCVELSTARIEQAGRVTLPAGTQILQSGSSSFLLSASATALVRPPTGQNIGLGVGYEQSPVSGLNQNLRDMGFAKLDAENRQQEDRYTYTVYDGTDDQGRRLAYIDVEWNG